MEWFTKAANQGNATAQYWFGYIYENEDEVKDQQKAINWYQKAADNNYEGAKKEVKQLNSKGYYAKEEQEEEKEETNDKNNNIGHLFDNIMNKNQSQRFSRSGSNFHRQSMAVSTMMRNRNASNSSLSSSLTTSPIMTIPVSIPSDESERYKTYFEQLDTDKQGYLSGQDAAAFFRHSKLSSADLSQIWRLADTKLMGKLDLHDFSVAMHLIHKRLNGDNIEEVVFRANALNEMQIQHVHNIQIENKRKAELEKQLGDVKKEIQTQWQLAEDYRAKKKEIAAINNQLEKDVFQSREMLKLTKKFSGEAGRVLEMEQERRYSLLQNCGLTSLSKNKSKLNTKQSVMPDLTRIPSGSSNSTGLMSPSTAATNLNSDKFYLSSSGDKKSPQGPLSPVQSKTISKYDFDLTVLKAPSKPIGNEISDKDELASLLEAPVSSTKKATTSNDIRQQENEQKDKEIAQLKAKLSRLELGLDDNADNDINYDSSDDDSDNDINYDTECDDSEEDIPNKKKNDNHQNNLKQDSDNNYADPNYDSSDNEDPRNDIYLD